MIIETPVFNMFPWVFYELWLVTIGVGNGLVANDHQTTIWVMTKQFGMWNRDLRNCGSTKESNHPCCFQILPSLSHQILIIHAYSCTDLYWWFWKLFADVFMRKTFVDGLCVRGEVKREKQPSWVRLRIIFHTFWFHSILLIYKYIN